MNRRGFLTAVAGGAALLALGACDSKSTGGRSGGADCDADDLVEGDTDCGGKSKSTKKTTKPKPAKTGNRR